MIDYTKTGDVLKRMNELINKPSFRKVIDRIKHIIVPIEEEKPKTVESTNWKKSGF